jgi:stage II sporulation protein D
MRRIFAVSLLTLAVTICLPLLLRPARDDTPSATPSPVVTESPGATAAPSEALSDEEILFTCLIDGVEREMSMAAYLPGMLAGEMPASFAEEALKAQAVAGRSYTLYRMAHPNPAHPDAAVCDDSLCCAAWKDEQSLRELWGASYNTYMQKILAAVRDTDGQVLCFDNEPIQAVFHSSSAGYTEDSAAVWSPIPYLVSVSSPETEAEVPNYITTVEVTAADFRAEILELQPTASLDGPPEGWLGEVERDTSGRVQSMAIGGTEISGTALRSAFSLRSTSFTLEYAQERFLFTVTGYGHGVGMSQFGANVMAKAGADYREILAHYYPDTVLRTE